MAETCFPAITQPKTAYCYHCNTHHPIDEMRQIKVDPEVKTESCRV